MNKELILNPKGIKVLSLFFIDRVANYRYYDENGNAHKGRICAPVLKKHYRELIRLPKYRNLFDDIDNRNGGGGMLHDGLFCHR